MLKILLIEDSKFQRLRLERALKSAEHSVTLACDGKEGLEKIHSDEPYDLIISDLMMPVMTGLELLEELKGKPNIPPIVILTADIQQPVKNRCLELGAKKFVNKPVSEEELVNEVKSFAVS